MKHIDRWALLKIMSDRSSMEIFQHLARSYDVENFDGTSLPITKTSLTRRQYYRRLTEMIKIGLVVKNKNRKYSLSSFGILIHFHLQSIDKVIDHYWKIQAVDAMRNAVASKKLSGDEFQKVIEGLIGDQVIKKLLLGETMQNDLLLEETKQNIITGK